MKVHYDKFDIDKYIEHMSEFGYKHHNTTYNELSKRFITLNNTKDNKSGTVITIKPVSEMIMTLGCLSIELCDKNGSEISLTNKIVIKKVKFDKHKNEDVVIVDRLIYEFLSMRNKLNEKLPSYHKFYRFNEVIELNGNKNEQLEIYVTNPSIDIDSKNTKIIFKCHEFNKNIIKS